MELWADEYSFIVRLKKNEKYLKRDWHFPSLGFALEEVFDYLVKKGALKSERKDVEGLKEVIAKTREDLRRVIRNLKPPQAGSGDTGEVFNPKQ